MVPEPNLHPQFCEPRTPGLLSWLSSPLSFTEFASPASERWQAIAYVPYNQNIRRFPGNEER